MASEIKFDSVKTISEIIEKRANQIKVSIVRTILDGGSLKRSCCVCDEKFLPHQYEETMLFENNSIAYQVFINDGKHVATAILTADEQDPTVAKLDLFCVAPIAQGTGVSELLMVFVLFQMFLSGIKKVDLGVSKGKSNPRAIAFYRKMGFEVYDPNLIMMENRYLITSVMKSVLDWSR